MGNAVHVAVAGDVYDGVLLPTRCLIWDLGLTLVFSGFSFLFLRSL